MMDPVQEVEEVVISGISGKFPQCENMDEFSAKLFAGVDMISGCEGQSYENFIKLPRVGFLSDISKFDAQFFSVHGLQADVMDPMMRMLLELSYEAIIDSGYNPEQIRGSNIGVYVGHCGTENYEIWHKYADRDLFPFAATGHAASLFANRISYCYDFKGASMAIDNSWPSFMTALMEAFKAVKRGDCDGALVSGSRLCRAYKTSLAWLIMGMTSPTGVSKPFDENENGYVQSEAIGTVFIQKKSFAKRCYATILNINANMGGIFKVGNMFPTADIQTKLMHNVYTEANVHPSKVEYLEADASGSKDSDIEELNAATDFFCKDREIPLLVGTVKSNMGNSEPASGFCSLAKVILAMEKGIIPPTIGYEEPNKDIPALHDGRISITDKPVSYKGGLVAINSFGFCGSNVHAVLKPNLKTTNNDEKHCLPKLVAVSGRTEEAVKNFLEKVEKADNDYVLHMIHDIHSDGNIRHHFFRGYSVFNTEEPLKEITMYEEVKRPVWFIFPGMGTQWHGMGKDLMEIEIFRESVKKCSAVLEPYGINMYDIIRCGREEIMDKKIFLTAITVIQIALVDLLFALDIQPDGIIGHSNGETVAAYADGAFTLEQAVLCVYFKIKSLIEARLSKGSMASIGLSWSEAEARCPPDICVACDNCDDNVTVSGPSDAIKEFVKTLQSENIFAKEVPNSIDVAFHSKYILDSVPAMKKYVQEIIPCPKQRSSRWISTSVPSSEWDGELAQTCSVDYYVNNSLSPVYFREALTHIPENAVVIEVSPHCLFQSILKRALPSSCINIGLSKRLYPSNIEFFMYSIGKLYNLGLQPKIQVLYPKIEYPVPRGTPSLSHMVEWMHSKTWISYTRSHFQSFPGSSKFMYIISPNRDKYQFLKGHVIDGHRLYPATGYLWLVWNGFSILKLKRVEELPVTFENVRFHRATHLLNRDIEVQVDILSATGYFELHESNDLIASGRIMEGHNTTSNVTEELHLTEKSNNKVLSTNDIYKELRLCHYEYRGIFKGIVSADVEDLTGELQWNENWVAFLDTMLQFSIVGFLGVRKLCVPIGIEKFSINPEAMNSVKAGEKIVIKANRHLKCVKADGVEASGLNIQVIPTRDQHAAPVLQKYVFVPYENITSTQFTATEAEKHALTAVLQIVLENSKTVNPCVVEVAGSRLPENLLIKEIANICKNEPEYTVHLNEIADDVEEYSKDETVSSLGINFISQDYVNKLRNEDILLLVGTDILQCSENENFHNVTEFLKPGAFILLEESKDINVTEDVNNWKLVCCYLCGDKQLLLFKVVDTEILDTLIVTFTEKNFNWIEKLKSTIKESEETEKKIMIVSQGEKYSGILGLINCLKKEISVSRIRCVFIQDKTAPKFSLTDPFYSRQLKKDLLMNVYSNDLWGSYRYLNLEKIPATEQQFAHVGIQTIGNMNTLTWIQSPIPTTSNSYYVYYSALNFKDIMLASGRLSLVKETAAVPLGHEFSGRDINGQRVFGIVENFGLSTVVTNPLKVMKVPNHWTLEEAATVPIVYGTVYYALIVRGKMKKGQTILIHSGCGGVGLAAITVALHMGVTVYATVGSQEKREFLKKKFPQLADRNIANSRDTSFEQHIIKETKGEGVDLVLNSLSEDKLQASLRCLRNNGKFLEIGKYDLAINNPLGTSLFLKNISFHGIAFNEILNQKDEFGNVMNILEQEIESRIVQPLPTTVFSEEEVSDAFRFLSSGKHIGKILIQIQEEELDRATKPALKSISALSRVYFSSEKVYIIVGGLGGLGLELANWLISRGASKLMLTSRTGIKNGYQASRIDMWKTLGADVIISTVDCTEESGVTQLISEANNLGDVGGIFNLAVVLKDNFFVNLTEDDFQTTCKPKIVITENLDTMSQKLCPNLEYFVIFSSLATGVGNAQQCNYAWANSAVERICEDRKSANLPALAIQWGPVDDVGILAELMDGRSMEILGRLSQRISSCLSILDTLLIQKHTIVSSMVVADKINKMSLEDTDILEIIGETLGIPNIREMSPNTTLAQLGADSFVVTAIKQRLEKDYNKVLSTDEIRNLTLRQIKEFSEKKGHDKVGLLVDVSSSLEMATDAPNDTLPIHIPTEVLVKLPSSNMDMKNNVKVFFIHSSQGVVMMLEPLASLLPAHVWGLQCTVDCPCDSLQELAGHYIQHIKTVQQNGPYIISSYSFGASLSFEIGLQLEKSGETVTVIMLDGSVQVNVIYDHQQAAPSLKGKLTDDIISLSMFLFLCGYTKAYENYTYLLAIKTWDQQVLSVTKLVSKDLNIPEDQVKQAVILYHRRFVANQLYQPTEKLSGELVLIKSNNLKNNSNIDKDYRLNEVCMKKVIIHEIDDSHYGIIKNEESLKTIQTIFKTIIEKLC